MYFITCDRKVMSACSNGYRVSFDHKSDGSNLTNVSS